MDYEFDESISISSLVKDIQELCQTQNLDDCFQKLYNEKCKGYQYSPAIFKAVDRLIVMGDIHGDYELAIEMLKIGGVIKVDNNDNVRWIGGESYVVQVGDQIDRCRPYLNKICSSPNTTINDEASDIKILKLFNDLHKQAIEKGGAVISLLGNHEIMNAKGELSYVSYQGLKEFENYQDPNNENITFRSGHDARVHAFKPGNQYGTMLGCTRYPAVIIGDVLLVHAGIIDEIIHILKFTDVQDIETINKAVRLWLLGLLKKKSVRSIIKNSSLSMFWTRILGQIPPETNLDDPVCIDHIGDVLKLFKVGNIIIGHTPQAFIHGEFGSDLNSTCSGTVWRVDNASSHAFDEFDEVYKSNKDKSERKVRNSRRPQVLVIEKNKGIKTIKICDKFGCKDSKKC